MIVGLREEKSLESNCGNKGFTLLETLIAMTIMVIAFASILATQSSSINATRRARELSVVAMLAKNAMQDTEFELQGKSFEEVKKEDSAAFKAPYDSYRWSRVIKKIEFPDLNFTKSSDTASSNGDTSTSDLVGLMTRLVAKFFSDALREVTVTVSFQSDGKTMKYDVTTYWVDLNHEFQVSE